MLWTRDVAHEHTDLAISRLPQAAAVLSLHAAAFRPALEKRGLVEHANRADRPLRRGRHELFGKGGLDSPHHVARFPRRDREELLQRDDFVLSGRRAVPSSGEPQGNPLDVLATFAQEQPPQIDQRMSLRFLSSEAGSISAVKAPQFARHSAHFIPCHGIVLRDKTPKTRNWPVLTALYPHPNTMWQNPKQGKSKTVAVEIEWRSKQLDD